MPRFSALSWLAALVYLFLYFPLWLLVVYSFNDSRFGGEWQGWTFKWYAMILEDEALLSAVKNSLLIASITAVIATLLGTAAGFALKKVRREILVAFIAAPLAAPEIFMGVSLLVFFIVINLTLGILSVTLAHIMFCIAYVALVVRAGLASQDESLVDSARDLGATPWQAFFRVTLPLLAPAIIAGALLSFTLSLDDFVITYFTSGAGATTLPVYIYSMIRVGITPEINAISTILMGLSFLFLTIAARITPFLRFLA
jgi:spermidine/putrescine transport system permease protein